jgi:hypothetical protein
VSQRLRECDLHLAADLRQFGETDPPIDDGITLGANRLDIPNVLGNTLIISHIACRKPRRAASDAVNLAGQTRSLVFFPTRAEEINEVPAQDQSRAPFITGRQTTLDPLAHCVLVNAHQMGDLFYRVAAMDFDQTMVGVPLSL